MSKLGDYVHLSWEGYKNKGTLTSAQKGSSFIFNIFDMHYYDTLSRVEYNQIPKTELKALENIYNNRNKDAANSLKSLVNNKDINHSGLKHLINKINAEWPPSLVEEIINGLEWDDSIENYRYKPQTNSRSFKYTVESSAVPSLRWKGKWHTIKPVITYAYELLNYLNSQKSTGDASIVNKDYETVKKYYNRLMESSKLSDDFTIRSRHRITKQTLTVLEKNAMKAEQTELEAIVTKLNAIRAKYLSVEQINEKIQASLAEIMGNLTVKGFETLKPQLLKQILDVALTTGRTSSTVIDKGAIIAPNPIIAAKYEAMAKNDSKIESLFKTEKSTDGSISYSFRDLGIARAQKRDAEIEFNEKIYGVSIKNTKIPQSQFEMLKGYTISLQSSSLLLFLANMQTEWSNLGTHYLNILAHHDDVANDNIYNAMHQDALKALQLYILWSSMTGRGQLRSEHGAADILAIYDKTANHGAADFQRVKFFDMATLIVKIAESNFQEGVQFSPQINNSFDIENQAEDTIGARLTKVLINARRKNIKASLYTSFLT